MSEEQIAEELLPVAITLVGTVRDYGPEQVAEVLAPLSEGRLYRLAIVLAAMVDPEARPQQLLAWTEMGPVPSRPFDPAYPQAVCPVCGELMAETSLARHQRRAHQQAVA